MAANLDLVVDMGSDFEVDLLYRDFGGSPVDLSTWTAKLQVKPTALGSAIFTLTESSGIQLFSNGGIIIKFTQAQTLLLNPGSNVYDLFLNDGTLNYRILYGAVTAVLNVTTVP